MYTSEYLYLYMEFFILNNGVEMPAIGLGTAFIPLEKLQQVVGDAYSVGYRKFDTAWLYGNENQLGNAFKSLGINRESIFLTSKIHARNLYYMADRRWQVPKKSIRKAIEGQLKDLNTDYLDLILIHWPFKKYLHIYEELVDLMESNPYLFRAIGVSSWFKPHLDKAIDATGITPALNQFEINPYLTNQDLISYCQNHGIQVESYSSLGSQNAKEILGEKTITEIADKLGKTPSQVVLRWLTQRSISIVPRSTFQNSSERKSCNQRLLAQRRRYYKNIGSKP